MKHSPLEGFHQGNNATFVEHNGWRLPAHFGDPDAEYRAVRRSAGWIDLANRAFLSFSGPDATDWLQGMLSNEIKSLHPGEGTHAAVLNIQGKILADVRVFCTEDGYGMDLWEPLRDGILEHLQRYLIADEVEITDRSGEVVLVSIQGPDAAGIISALFQTDRLPTRTLGHESLDYGGRSIHVISSSHTGEGGFDLLLEEEPLHRMVADDRHESPATAVPWIGLEAQNVLRIEAGIPLYGVDMNEGTLLLETNLDAAVSFTKGCYLGQEVVERIHSRGHVNKKLVGLKCRGDRVPVAGDAIVLDPKDDVGVITSAVFSPHCGCPVALGYVDREYAAADRPLLVRHHTGPIPAIVTQLPFYSKS